MQESLARKTANLESLPGKFQEFPTTTADAIYSGALHALSGAIERMAKDLAPLDDCIVLTGGSAEILQSHLLSNVRYQESLVLDGLINIAQERVAA